MKYSLILLWVNMSDLFRIKDIGDEFANLLEATGLASVPELAQRNAVNLKAKRAQLNVEQSMRGSVPSQTGVEGGSAQTKELGKGITD